MPNSPKHSFILILLLAFTSNLFGQKEDTFGFTLGLTGGLSLVETSDSIFVSGRANALGEYTESFLIPANTKGNVSSLTARAGMNIPVYKSFNWSIGLNLNAGVGLQMAKDDLKGLAGMYIELPQYAYYRRYGGSFDFAVLLGYRLNLANLNSDMLEAGFEVHFKSSNSLRLSASLVPLSVWGSKSEQFSDANIRANQFGLVFTHYLYK